MYTVEYFNGRWNYATGFRGFSAAVDHAKLYLEKPFNYTKTRVLENEVVLVEFEKGNKCPLN
jgi:hypothetical protein